MAEMEGAVASWLAGALIPGVSGPDGLASRPGRVEILLATSCYRNQG